MTDKRILIIEDEFVIALEITSVLEDAGFRNIRHVNNAPDALRIIGQEDWDGIVADANLDGTSIEQLAVAMTTRSIPFIVVTGYGRETLPGSVGNAPVIEKPFFGPDVARALVGILETGPSSSESEGMLNR